MAAHRAPPPPPKKEQQRSSSSSSSAIGALLAVLVAALCGAFVYRERPSQAMMQLRKQLSVGRAHYEARRWVMAEAALGDPIARYATQLTSTKERTSTWPALLAAGAHRAKAAYRAAELVEDPEERHLALERSAMLFEVVRLQDAESSLGVLDFVYENSMLLRRLSRPEQAVELFGETESANGILPWKTADQMPCCDFKRLLMETMQHHRRQPPAQDDVPWRQDLLGVPGSVPALLAAHAADIRAEALAYLAKEPQFTSLEGHGAEVLNGSTGRLAGSSLSPWSELLLYDPKAGWRGKVCAEMPTTCRLLKAHVAIVTRDGEEGAYCCRVEILRLGPMSRVLPHTAPTKTRLKAHLGLSVPMGAALDIADQRRPWADSEILVFDDSFWHQAWNNNTDQPRLLLSVDFWKHPLSAVSSK